MDEPNLFKNPEFRKDLEFINDQLSKTKLGRLPTESPARSDATKVADAIAPPVSEEASRLDLDNELAQVYASTLAPVSRAPVFKLASCNSVKTHRVISALMLKCVGGWE